MINKDTDLKESFKANRYNQIDLIGSYGIKDNVHIGGAAKKRDKDEVVSLFKWLCIIFISIIPIVNVLALIIMACTDINLSIKNFAKGALIIIFILVFLFLLYL